MPALAALDTARKLEAIKTSPFDGDDDDDEGDDHDDDKAGDGVSRPIIAMPARFSASASALRYGADVMARALMDAVWAAGGEPVVIHPVAPVIQATTGGNNDGGNNSGANDAASAGARAGAHGVAIDPSRGFAGIPDDFVDQVAERVAFADGVLLPGGGDISPVWTGDALHATHYDVDVEQDAFDFALARVVLERGIPTLAICRGMQLLNVALGGTLHFDMDDELGVAAHRHRVERVDVDPEARLAGVVGRTVMASCYHHQCLKDVAPRWQVVARSSDGITEAVELNRGGAGSGEQAPDDVQPGDAGSSEQGRTAHDGPSSDPNPSSPDRMSQVVESPDRTAEAVELRTAAQPEGADVVAIQWHPEDTFRTDPQQHALFLDLVERTRS